MGRVYGVALAGFLSAVAALAGCGGGAETSQPAQGGSARSLPRAPASGCGSVPTAAPKDPDHVVAALPERYQAAYSGYATPIRRSAWENWTPPHPPPYTIGIEWNAITTDFQRVATEQLQERLKASPLVKDVIFQSTGNNLDVGQQIQQTNQLIQKKPDLVILEVLTADSFTRAVNELAAMNIPTIIAMDSAYAGNANAVNIQPNAYAGLAQTTAAMLRLIKGAGNIAFVHGLATTGVDQQSFKGFKAALARCPRAKLTGEVFTDFTVANAKSEFLKFAATHPQPLAGIAETAGASPGVMSALQQSGRQVPPVMMNGDYAGSLSYWKQHKDTYASVGYGFGGDALAETTADVALRMLDGQGIKLTDVTNAPPLITAQNLDDWAPAEPVSLFSPSESGTPAGSFTDDEYLDGLFSRPRAAPTK